MPVQNLCLSCMMRLPKRKGEQLVQDVSLCDNIKDETVHPRK